MDKCFHDGQIPCRWVEDMGYGYGYPLFNFYPPFPYLLGQVIRTFGFQYIDVVKIVGITGFLVTAIGMYALAKEFWGKNGGLISSLVYTYAPYHSVDFYVRGAMNEFWAMAWYPYIAWATYKIILQKKNNSPLIKWIIVLSVSLAGLLLSHNPMTMIFVPLYGIWAISLLLQNRSISSIKSLLIAGMLGLGLAAFFTLPVIFEQKYAHVETLIIGYFNYLAHFLNLNQIFLDINWGYGESKYLEKDTMSFALGYLQWLLPALVAIAVVINKKSKPFRVSVLVPVALLLFALFMTHSRSSFIWSQIKPLEFLQFPWRFLTVACFFAAFVSGSIAKIVPLNSKIVILLCVAIVGLNVRYFQPREWYKNMSDAEKFSGKSWQLLITSGIFDYLPIFAPMPPADPAKDRINITAGTGQFKQLTKTTNHEKYEVNISSKSAIAEIQTYYFPGWKLWVNGKEQQIDPQKDPLLGRIQASVTEGENIVEIKFTNTPIRQLGNTISVISFVILIGLGIYSHRKQKHGY